MLPKESVTNLLSVATVMILNLIAAQEAIGSMDAANALRTRMQTRALLPPPRALLLLNATKALGTRRTDALI